MPACAASGNVRPPVLIRDSPRLRKPTAPQESAAPTAPATAPPPHSSQTQQPEPPQTDAATTPSPPTSVHPEHYEHDPALVSRRRTPYPSDTATPELPDPPTESPPDHAHAPQSQPEQAPSRAPYAASPSQRRTAQETHRTSPAAWSRSQSQAEPLTPSEPSATFQQRLFPRRQRVDHRAHPLKILRSPPRTTRRQVRTLDRLSIRREPGLIVRPSHLHPLCEPPRTQLRRSEEHTSELQSPTNLVCRLLLEKKKQGYALHREGDVEELAEARVDRRVVG